MATQERTVALIVGQLAGVGGISAGKMFGEYGIWRDGKVVALICDDQLFVKPTAPGRDLAGGAAEVPPYSGTKPSLLVDPDRWDDADWLVALIRATADALPAPRTRRGKPKATLPLRRCCLPFRHAGNT